MGDPAFGGTRREPFWFALKSALLAGVHEFRVRRSGERPRFSMDVVRYSPSAPWSAWMDWSYSWGDGTMGTVFLADLERELASSGLRLTDTTDQRRVGLAG